MSQNQIRGTLVVIIFALLFIGLGLVLGYIFELFTLNLSNLGYFAGILAVLGSIFGIYLENKYKKIQALEENLRTERRKIYMELFRPYILIFSAMNSQEKDPIKKKQKLDGIGLKVQEIINTEDYTKNCFEYVIFGSDEAVKANNQFMQYLYNSKENTDSRIVFKLMADVFLAARKDVGVKDTKLSETDLFKWKITDLDRYFPSQNDEKKTK
ncbi:hypothetical protein J2128_001303 [Methanomicrobium sp. W14]|uniref:hypothetical protein n=1 Tax=Methanomicrobium sp. W14 TaxID=2817839 RepID=UPI001AE19898|nr:hypothetical protein [Methanomicrobium sp. W14]MBP2133349.1 hypothetical protein [Methanomicrobium sp. W14]